MCDRSELHHVIFALALLLSVLGHLSEWSTEWYSVVKQSRPGVFFGTLLLVRIAANAMMEGGAGCV